MTVWGLRTLRRQSTLRRGRVQGDELPDTTADRTDLRASDDSGSQSGPLQETAPNSSSQVAQESNGGDVVVERALLDQAVGGWRGLIDSGAPALVFVTWYLATGAQMRPSLIAALAAGFVIMVWRVLRRESLQQVISGFIGVAVSAWVASRTGRPQDFFLLGILTNLGYGLAMLVSLLVGWPAIGLLVGSLQGDPVGWRKVRRLRAAYRLCTWIWVAVFFGRLLFTVPLYLAGAVGALGVAKVLLGWPPFLLAVYLCYRILHPVLAAERAAAQGQTEPAAEAVIQESALCDDIGENTMTKNAIAGSARPQHQTAVVAGDQVQDSAPTADTTLGSHDGQR